MLTAFAQGAQEAPQTMGGGTFTIIYLIAMVAIFYFLLIRPQKKRQRETANMLDNLQVNDEVVTAGGIKGNIVSIKEDSVIIETGADRTKITFEKSAILAKKALTRSVNERSNISYVAEMEKELLEEINKTGIGPAGLGGTTTALAVNINTYPTHIAGLPVAINICCHVNRHSVREI